MDIFNIDIIILIIKENQYMNDIKQLRSLIESHQSIDFSNMTMNEALDSLMLDEAFFGKKPVIPIQRAMNDCYNVIMNNPQIDMIATRQAASLNKSLVDVFGFRFCRVYWNNNPALGTGPCTFPRCKFLHASDFNAQSYMYGKNNKGFYDAEHSLAVFIQTDQTLFTEARFTPEEMTAIILHEVGHNFDYSPYTVLYEWYYVFSMIVQFAMNPTDLTPLAAIGMNVIGKELGGMYDFFYSLDNILLNIIPPVGYFVRLTRKFGFNVLKLLQAIISPVTMAVLVPIELLMTPFQYLGNFQTRVGEVYADSFAASYGYGAELGTALEKLNRYAVYNGPGSDSFLQPFYDLAMLQADFITMCAGGHMSTQQRFKTCIDKLDHDLEQTDLTREDKAMIKAERDRIVDTYNKFVSCDADRRSVFTRSFREMLDNWYAGKNYMITPTFDRAIRYAK